MSEVNNKEVVEPGEQKKVNFDVEQHEENTMTQKYSEGDKKGEKEPRASSKNKRTRHKSKSKPHVEFKLTQTDKAKGKKRKTKKVSQRQFPSQDSSLFQPTQNSLLRAQRNPKKRFKLAGIEDNRKSSQLNLCGSFC